MKMALATLDTALSGNRHSSHPSPPPADEVKVVTPVSPIEGKSALVMLDQRGADSLPPSRSPSSLPLSPPSDHHPASPAPSDQPEPMSMDPSVTLSALKAEEAAVASPAAPASSQKPASAVTPASPTLSATDAKLCRQLLNSLKKHKDAWPFQVPVDPVAVGAPGYFDVIKNPMDLSTVDRKLVAREYVEVQAFANDIQLMFNNCFTYNPPTNTVHHAGRALESHFSLQLNKLFPTLTTETGKVEVIPDATAGSRRHSRRNIKPPKVFEPEVLPTKKPRASISNRRNSSHNVQPVHEDDPMDTSDDDEIVSQQISTLASCLETINQQLALLTEKKTKRKRSSTGAAPAAASAPKRRRSTKAQVSRSSTSSPVPGVVEEEALPAAAAAAGPEKQCEYCGTSETPMWRRGPSGCGTLCNKCGVKWRNGKIMGDNRIPDVPVYSANTPFRPKPKARKVDANGNPLPPRSRTGPKNPRKKTKSISYDQKKELSLLIGDLSEEHMVGVVEIIRSGLPHLRDTMEEIEIDIDTIDDVTLYALYEFVKKASRAPKVPQPPTVKPGPKGLSSMTPSDDEESESDGGSSSSDSD